jgi:PPE-repeat protein
MGKKSHLQEPVTRRNLLKKGAAAGALGAAAATAITATPASAADGDPIILGRVNEAFSPTQITLFDVGDSLDIFGGGSVLRADMGFGGPVISAHTLGGPAISASAEGAGVIGFGQIGPGVSGASGVGIGVRGRTEVGTGIKAEAAHFESEGTAFEAVGPVKFSTSGLADVAAPTDRVTVDPGVPITSRSKVLAMLQGNSGNKAAVEHVEVNPVAATFQVVLTKVPARSVQIAWFLIS